MMNVPDPGFRVDTGTLTFGKDWPGYFMRGDHALGQANGFDYMAKYLEEGKPIASVVLALRNYANALRACQAQDAPLFPYTII